MDHVRHAWRRLKDLATAAGFIPGTFPWPKARHGTRALPLFVAQLKDARPYQYPSEAIPRWASWKWIPFKKPSRPWHSANSLSTRRRRNSVRPSTKC